jgi:uncharacterized protein YjeT (DUF2065 family)
MDEQMTNNDLAVQLIKVMEGIATIGAAQADTNGLVAQLAERTARLIDEVGRLADEAQRALGQLVWREQTS